MFGKRRFPDRPLLVTSALALSLCLLLSACGGDGNGVASTPPPPPTPTPSPAPALPPGTTLFNYAANGPIDVRTSWLDSPTTRSGTTDVIGLLSLFPGNGGQPTTRAAAAGEFTVTTAQQQLDHQYLLKASSGIFPAGLTALSGQAAQRSWDINDTLAYLYENPYGDTPQYFGQRLSGFSPDGKQLFSYDYTRSYSGGGLLGLGGNQNVQSTLSYDVGYSYVAMGEWSWRVVDLNGNPSPGSDSGRLLFVNGDRTPATGIPVTGTATYDARAFGWVKNPFALTADFGQRTMSTRIDQDYASVPGDLLDDPIPGIHVAGSAPFSNNGLFNIPLSGTANYDGYNRLVAPPAEAVTGTMNGAFFGPNAEQVGGVFSLDRSSGVQMLKDAFVGQRRRP